MARINRNYVLLGCLCSMASGSIWPVMPSLIWMLPIVVLIGCLFSRNHGYWLQGLLLGCLIIIIHGNHYRHVTETLFSHGKTITVQARIVALNQPTLHGKQTMLSISRIESDHLPFYTRPQVKLYYATSEVPALKLGELWQLQLEVKPAFGRLNDAGYDNERYYVSNQWHGKAVIVTNTPINHKLIDSASWRLYLHQKTLPLLDKFPAKPFILALAFGDRSEISSQQWAQLRDSGLSHLMAISGLHIALMMTLGWALGRSLKSAILMLRPNGYQVIRFLPLCSSFIAAWFYAYLAGFSLPTQRALVMGCLVLSMLCLRIHWSAWQILLFSLVMIVALQPFSILQMSFWLSFSAILIIYISMWFYQQKGHGWRDKVLKVLVIQMGLFGGLSILSIGFFGGVSWVSPLVNLLVIPWVSFVVVPSIVFALICQWLLAFVVSIHAQTFIWGVVDGLLSPVMWILQQTEGAWLAASAKSMLVVLGLVIASILWRLRCYILLYVLVVGGGIVMLFPPYFQPNWRVQILDVGQGLAILIRKDGESVLYDTGVSWQGGSMANSVIVPLLQQEGERQLSGLIISHTDSDHAGGRLDIEQQLQPQWRRSSERLPHYLPCVKGQSWQWQGLSFEALWPPKSVARAYNPHSCVIRVSDAIFSILLTGDIDAISEILLTREQNIAAVDVMTVPHHGSATSSFPTLLEAFTPTVAIASLAVNNQWGLPNQAVKQRYQKANIDWLDTGTSGQITLSIYSNDWHIKQKRGNQYQPWYRQIVRNGLE